MPRMESKVVPEGNAPIPRQEEFGSHQTTLADLYRLFEKRFDRQLKIMKSCFDRWDRKLDEMAEDWRSMDQRLTRLKHDAWQPRLVMEADGPANTKTRERTEDAATAVQAKHGDSCSADRVNPDPMCSASFGDDCTGPPAPPCSEENALVDNGTAAPKSCLPFLEMRSPTATGGLLPTDEATLATMTTYNQPSLRLYSTEETSSKETYSRTLILHVSYDSILLQESY